LPVCLAGLPRAILQVDDAGGNLLGCDGNLIQARPKEYRNYRLTRFSENQPALANLLLLLSSPKP
jgi:hypothetical protein